MSRLISIAASSLFLLLTACGDDGGGASADAPPPTIDAEPAPAFRNPVALPDDQLATQALTLLGATGPQAEPRCGACHSMTRQHLRFWRALSDTSMSSCLTDLSVATPESARAMIDCLRAMPTVPTSKFQAIKLGVWATAVHLPWFEFAFRRAYGGDVEYQQFKALIAMPPAGQGALTQDQFDIVAEWFSRGLPQLDASLPEDPPPDQCNEGTSADVAAHVAELATTGWRAVNTAAGMNMFGCTPGQPARQCLTTEPTPATAWADTRGAGWEVSGTTQRVLADLDYASSFWTRSSASGRYVAHGIRNNMDSGIVDLQADRVIGVNAFYDPAFFPDDSGFVFQGGPRNVCRMSVLTGAVASISMTEAGCSDLNQVGLYQHVGAALGGGDYFAIDGMFVSDDGGHGGTFGDPSAFFGGNAEASITPMVYGGSTFTAKPSVSVPTPYEGDAVLSPSARLFISRVAGPGDNQLGYVLRKVIATPSGGSYQISAPEVARYCVSGGKPAFSYDERWIVYHHYLSPSSDADAQELGFTGRNDPGYAPYRSAGAANVYLLDLATGARTRITRMNPGQYALFPHFRSDGWIYIQVRDPSRGREYVLASDAALVRE